MSAKKKPGHMQYNLTKHVKTNNDRSTGNVGKKYRSWYNEREANKQNFDFVLAKICIQNLRRIIWFSYTCAQKINNNICYKLCQKDIYIIFFSLYTYFWIFFVIQNVVLFSIQKTSVQCTFYCLCMDIYIPGNVIYVNSTTTKNLKLNYEVSQKF